MPKLQVYVKHARGLVAKDGNTLIDPYVIVSCDNEVVKTTTKKRTLDPVFMETLLLPVNFTPTTTNITIQLSIKSKELVGKNVQVGFAEFTLDIPHLARKLKNGASQHYSVPLEQECGTLFISVRFREVDLAFWDPSFLGEEPKPKPIQKHIRVVKSGLRARTPVQLVRPQRLLSLIRQITNDEAIAMQEEIKIALDGGLSYYELLSNEERLDVLMIARTMDKNRDAVIDPQEIGLHFSRNGQLDNTELQQLISKMDLNGDGVISVAECCEYLSRQTVENKPDRMFKTQVLVRFRAFLMNEDAVSAAETEIRCTRVTLKQDQQEFMVDRVFGVGDQQDDVLSVIAPPMIINAMRGFNISLISTGYKHTGKTYSAFGQSTNPKYLHAGLFSRLVEKLFSVITSTLDDFDYMIKFSCYEIRSDDKVMDLIGGASWKGLGLTVTDDQLVVEKINQEHITSDEQIYSALDSALQKRKIDSSVFAEILLLKKDLREDEPSVTSSRITFIDTALKPYMSICDALQNQTEISSNLGKLLNYRLMKNCLPYIFMNCSPVKEYENGDETLKSLQFAKSMMNSSCKAVINQGQMF
jgi:hypothetical protein